MSPPARADIARARTDIDTKPPAARLSGGRKRRTWEGISVTARSIKSAERTLGLLELFSRRQCPLTVGDVTRGLSIPQPSASMLLANLAEVGYLDYDRRTRSYSPSIRVAMLGSWISHRFSAIGDLAERLNDLQARTGETAYIGIQNGASAQYVLSINSDAPDRMVVDSGQMRTLTCSAFGRVLLALKSDAEVTRWTRRCNAEASSERYKVQEGPFLDLIHQIRTDGYGQTQGETTPGLGALSVHIYSPMGQTPLAIGVGGPIPRMQAKHDTVLEALREFQTHFRTRPFDDAELQVA
jgi:IclR family KDG regulon transcriptional repressor